MLWQRRYRCSERPERVTQSAIIKLVIATTGFVVSGQHQLPVVTDQPIDRRRYHRCAGAEIVRHDYLGAQPVIHPPAFNQQSGDVIFLPIGHTHFT